jgi:hypothetical protein
MSHSTSLPRDESTRRRRAARRLRPGLILGGFFNDL